MTVFAEVRKSTVLVGLTLTRHDDKRWVATYIPLSDLEGRHQNDLALAVRELIVRAGDVIAGLRGRNHLHPLSAEERAVLDTMVRAHDALYDLHNKASDAFGEALESVEAGYADSEDVEWYEDIMGLRGAAGDPA